MKNFVLILGFVMIMFGLHADNIKNTATSTMEISTVKNDKIEQIVKHYPDGTITILDDGCNGVYSHWDLVYDSKKGEWVWYEYMWNCLCPDCGCSC